MTAALLARARSVAVVCATALVLAAVAACEHPFRKATADDLKAGGECALDMPTKQIEL